MLLSIFGSLIPHREDEIRNSLLPIRLYIRVDLSYFDSNGLAADGPGSSGPEEGFLLGLAQASDYRI